MIRLSESQRDALEHAAKGGGLRRIQGGFWIPANSIITTAEELLSRINRNAPPWSTSTHTVRALERRGLLTGGPFYAPRSVTDEGRAVLRFGVRVRFVDVGRTRATWEATLANAEALTLIREIRRRKALVSREIDVDNGMIYAGGGRLVGRVEVLP